MAWKDRWQAGTELARPLRGQVPPDALVLGIARGGVIIAAALARQLHRPLGAIVAKKVTPPDNPEFAIGAVAGEGEAVMGPWADRWPEAVKAVAIDEARRQVHARTEELGGTPDVRGRTVIVADDGVATGMTTLAAVRAVKAAGAKRVIVATPVVSTEAATMLQREADELVALGMPDPFWAVGAYYEDFRAVETDEVKRVLAAFNRGVETA